MEGERQLREGDALGRYVVLRRIGSGGMGAVYAARDPKLDRNVALKILRVDPDHPVAADGGARLLREAQTMGKLAHPNIVTVYDVGAEAGELFVAMELVDGQSVAEWLEQPRPWREVLDVFLRAGRGLEAAHRCGVVHRDVKPHNLLLSRDRRVLVTDFGLARAVSAVAALAPDELGRVETVTQSGHVLGTPAYMAPEQHQGGAADERSDQFSFCVALYQGLYGERPFGTVETPGMSTLLALGLAVVAGKVRPAPPGSRVPAGVRRVLLRGLAVAPEARWPTMGALLHALERARGASRRRWVTAATAAVLVGASFLALRARPADACRGGAARIAGVWDAPRAARVQAAFLASGLGGAGAVFGATARGLDAYAAAWAERHDASCAATRAGEQSAAVLDLGMQCLDQRRRELGALVDLLAGADRALVARAVGAVGDLRPVSDCADVTALTAPLPRPKGAAVGARMAAVDGELASGRALLGAGRYNEALGVFAAAAQETLAIDSPPLRADALYERGLLEQLSLHTSEAVITLDLAARVADEGRDDRTRAQALALLTIALHGTGRDVEGHRAARDAEGVLARLGGDPRIEAIVMANESTIYIDAKQYATAQPLLERAVAIIEPAGPPRLTAQVLAKLGSVERQLGHLDRSEAIYDRALDLVERGVGPLHPVVATVLMSLGNVRRDRGDLAGAAAALRRSVAVSEQVLGKDSLRLGAPLFNLGGVLRADGRFDEALAVFRRAYDLAVREEGPDSAWAGYDLLGIGSALAGGGDARAALPVLERAVALIEKAPHAASEELAAARFELAKALVATGADAARARALAAQARDGAPPEDAKVYAAWLAGR
jgi:eukaryotic-like serine/threonine-protein kinase